ncbi:hypothetical protein KGM48_01380 [Patescibacteria group bacterium]|nr:hypothetical protein [Patescibacteria group bacterium]
MIAYQFHNAKLLFIGINPHPGTFRRGVPFSNNKTFWYLLNQAGLMRENIDDLKDDRKLKEIYKNKFNSLYELGLMNLINRPTRDITELKREEELPGRKRIRAIIKREKPPIVCFIGKIAYERFSGLKRFSFGWQDDIFSSKAYVMHFPLRGRADIRVQEFKIVGEAAGLLKGPVTHMRKN